MDKVIYLTKDFIPTTADKAELVKVIYEDGRVVFGKPKNDPTNPNILFSKMMRALSEFHFGKAAK